MPTRYGVQPGDTITLQLPGGRVDVTVVGLLQTGDPASTQAFDNLILTDIATAQELVGEPGNDQPDRPDPAGRLRPRQNSRRCCPPARAITTPSQASGALGQMTAAFELNLQALSLLALVVGVFLIYNTVSFSVVQRRAVLGILRSIGATRRQIFALILGEALVLGLVGTLLGLGLGMIAGRGTVNLVAQTISDLYFAVDVQRVTVDPLTLLKGVAIGIGASLIAAVIPSLAATNTPPAGSLRRSQVEEQAHRLLIPVTLGALALNLIGVLLLTIPTNSLIVSFASLFSVVVGGALLTPIVLIAAMRLLTPLMSAIFGVLGRMATRAVESLAQPDGGRRRRADGRRERDRRRQRDDRLVPLDGQRLARYDAGRGHLHQRAVGDGDPRARRPRSGAGGASRGGRGCRSRDHRAQRQRGRARLPRSAAGQFECRRRRDRQQFAALRLEYGRRGLSVGAAPDARRGQRYRWLRDGQRAVRLQARDHARQQPDRRC